MSALQDEFRRELERSVQRIRDALAPYTRFVRAEREHTEHLASELRAALDELNRLRARVETTLTHPTTG